MTSFSLNLSRDITNGNSNCNHSCVNIGKKILGIAVLYVIGTYKSTKNRNCISRVKPLLGQPLGITVGRSLLDKCIYQSCTNLLLPSQQGYLQIKERGLWGYTPGPQNFNISYFSTPSPPSRPETKQFLKSFLKELGSLNQICEG